MAIYMLGVFTKHPPEKLEYWRKYRRSASASASAWLVICICDGD